MNANRIRDIDFWRGAVLIAILIDHIPGNPLENWTPRNFGLSDSAEAFVFLSGLSVGLIYVPRAYKYGIEPVAGGCLKRALKLYGIHIALTLAALVVFGAAYWMSGVSDLIQAHGRSFVFGSPANGLLGLALLSHQLGYFNILPLYVVLMLWAPAALALALRGPVLALLVSVGSIRGRARLRAQSPELAGARRLVLQSDRLAAHLHARTCVGDSVARRSAAACTVAGRAERRDGRGRRADRDQRGRPRAGAPRHGDRASRCRQAGSWTGASHPLCRIGLSDCGGDDVRAIHRAGGPGRLRQRRPKPWPQQPAGFRRRLGLERLRSGGARSDFPTRLGRDCTVRRTRLHGCVHSRPVRRRPLDRVQKRPSQRRKFCRATSTFTWLAWGSCILVALISAFTLNAARADEVACPGEVSAFDANGAVLAFPKGGASAPLDILAIGSSSTEGIGATSAANAYPAKLEEELEERTGVDFDVKNAGVGGELAAKTLERLKRALRSGWARLVIWQVGTNDAIVGVDEALFRATLKAGVAAVRAAGIPARSGRSSIHDQEPRRGALRAVCQDGR